MASARLQARRRARLQERRRKARVIYAAPKKTYLSQKQKDAKKAASHRRDCRQEKRDAEKAAFVLAHDVHRRFDANPIESPSAPAAEHIATIPSDIRAELLNQIEANEALAREAFLRLQDWKNYARWRNIIDSIEAEDRLG